MVSEQPTGKTTFRDAKRDLPLSPTSAFFASGLNWRVLYFANLGLDLEVCQFVDCHAVYFQSCEVS